MKLTKKIKYRWICQECFNYELDGILGLNHKYRVTKTAFSSYEPTTFCELTKDGKKKRSYHSKKHNHHSGCYIKCFHCFSRSKSLATNLINTITKENEYENDKS